MNWMKRILAVLVALTVMIGFTATPAHAAWTCPSGAFCIYDFGDGTGPSYYWNPMSGNYVCLNIGGAWNDRAGSVFNNHVNRFVALHRDANCQGAWVSIYGNQKKQGFQMGTVFEHGSSIWYSY